MANNEFKNKARQTINAARKNEQVSINNEFKGRACHTVNLNYEQGSVRNEFKNMARRMMSKAR